MVHICANEYVHENVVCVCCVWCVCMSVMCAWWGLITVCTYFAGLPKAISSSCRAKL